MSTRIPAPGASRCSFLAWDGRRWWDLQNWLWEMPEGLR